MICAWSLGAPSYGGDTATHARGAPPERATLTGVPRARAPFAPASAGGVSAGIGGWARDRACQSQYCSGRPDRAQKLIAVRRIQLHMTTGSRSVASYW